MSFLMRPFAAFSGAPRAATARIEPVGTAGAAPAPSVPAAPPLRRAVDAAALARRGLRLVTDPLQGIHASYRQIGTRAHSVERLAVQMHHLAAGASVHARRAGLAGAQIALAAGQLQDLAQRCLDNAREIQSLVHLGFEQVDTGSDTVQESGRAADEVQAALEGLMRALGEAPASAQTRLEERAALLPGTGTTPASPSSL